MAVVRKKQDDKNLKILRELVTSGGGNRQCFDCGQKGPTYVNMTIGSFVCTRCSGVLRGLTPPHRVKSISMATFTPDEIEFIKLHGNDICAKTWLGLWDPKRIIHQDQRELMIDKYERKRYYLEPASPLKSLTNATKVSPLNGGNNCINNSNNKQTDNVKNITLTPPNTLRLTSNNNNSINSNNNRQQHRYNFQNQFTPEENGFFDITSTTASEEPTLTNGRLIRKGVIKNGTRYNINVNKTTLDASTNLNNIISSPKNNEFTPDSDFVADFGSANIFNANANINGLQVHQNGTKPNLATNNQVQRNHFANGTGMITNGSSSGGSNTSVNDNGTSMNMSNANANFADFDHAPIYNAAVYQTYSNNNSFSSSNNNIYNIQTVQQPTSNNIYSNGDIFNNSQQWNVWQQFQSPFSTPTSEQNRWSLPMSLNSTTSNSSLNSTPPADRYAALKDLDEQLRENKIPTMETYNAQAPALSPNPFKTVTGSPPAGPHQSQTIGNPFQTSFNQSNNIFAQQSSIVPNAAFVTNSTITSPFSNQTNVNYNNGFNTAQTASLVTNGGNSCGGISYGTQQHILAASNNITNVKNPFAASCVSSNNPFL